jgi:hypothetical protein
MKKNIKKSIKKYTLYNIIQIFTKILLIVIEKRHYYIKIDRFIKRENSFLSKKNNINPFKN